MGEKWNQDFSRKYGQSAKLGADEEKWKQDFPPKGGQSAKPAKGGKPEKQQKPDSDDEKALEDLREERRALQELSKRDADKSDNGSKEKFIEQVEKSVDNPVARAAIEEFAPDDGDGTSAKPAEDGKSAKLKEGGKEKFIEQVEKSVENPVARAAIEEFAPDDGGGASEEKALKKSKADEDDDKALEELEEERRALGLSKRAADKSDNGSKEKFIEQVEKSVDNPVARAAIEEFAPDDGDGTSAKPAEDGKSAKLKE